MANNKIRVRLIGYGGQALYTTMEIPSTPDVFDTGLSYSPGSSGIYNISVERDSGWLGGDITIDLYRQTTKVLTRVMTADQIRSNDGVYLSTGPETYIAGNDKYFRIVVTIENCEDKRLYSDSYRITLNGEDSFGNQVSKNFEVNIQPGKTYLTEAMADFPNWFSINRVTARSLTGSSKNGVVEMGMRIYKTPTSPEGFVLGFVDVFQEEQVFATATFNECETYADVSTTGIQIGNTTASKLLNAFNGFFIDVTGFINTGVVCCDDKVDDTEKEGEGETGPISINRISY